MLERLARYVQRHCPRNDAGDLLAAALLFRRVHGHWPSLWGKPRSYNDEIFRLKIAERDNPLRALAIDKEYGKMLTDGILGKGFTAPVFGVLRSLEEAERYTFPDRCVIKPTHSSGRIILRAAGEPVNRDALRKWLSSNDQYESRRDKKYKHLERKIIVEEWLDFGAERVPEDFKIFVAFGRAKMVQHDVGRFRSHERRWYTRDWKPLPFTTQCPLAPTIDAPKNLEAMLEAAEKIGAHFSFVRVDLYSDGIDRIVVGEISSLPDGGCGRFHPDPGMDREFTGLFTDPEFDPAVWAK